MKWCKGFVLLLFLAAHGWAQTGPSYDSSGNLKVNIKANTASNGTVTTFSSGDLSPLFTTSVATPTTSPDLTFTLSSAAGYSWFGNSSASSGAPAFNTSTIPSSLIPNPSASTLGGIESLTCTNQFLNSISTAGVPACASVTDTQVAGTTAGATLYITSSKIAELATTAYGIHSAGATNPAWIAPSATSGVPLISQGSSATPTFGTAVVAGGGTGLTALTIYNLIVGNGTSAANLLAPSSTSGIPLVSQGASANPAYSTAVVAGGGTGLTALTAHYLVIGNGTSAATLLAPSSTSNVPLVSAGSSADPAWAPYTLPATVATGGIPYASSSSAITTLAASGTSSFPMLSAASAAPTWATIQYPTSCTSGGWVYGSSATALACGTYATANTLMKNGGAANGPAASSITDDGTKIVTTEPIYGASSSLVPSGTTYTTTAQSATSLTLAFPAVPISTKVRGSCNLLWQTTNTSGTVTFYLNTSASLTGMWIQGSTYYNAATTVQNLLPPAVVTSATSTAVTAAQTAASANVTYCTHVDVSMQTGASNIETVTVYGSISSSSYTLTLEPGSSCGWGP